ncbi:alpha/beta fold hydrolase [Amaricoccus sp.]|uniref:alpha/beta hydrolase n=1 Tax=Amaricoccus sp. TaxID=1872485 RepID=UPI001B41D423|nr:alpha/beta fold hydrolase [Amaricoccus sp.]MBP7241639.1 alpha/beta fold hydrolase [Amaricoccus sp.]
MDAAIAALSHLSVTQKALALIAVGGVALFMLAAMLALVLPARLAFAAVAGTVAIALAYLLLRPIVTYDLGPRPAPAADHAAALARFAADAAADPTPLNPLCHPRLLDHGERRPVAVVLLHGVSSCPQAFVDLAPALFARGHNVIAPRMPQNGYADRATDALARMTAGELRAWGDAAVDVAAGLGDEVVVLGISAGGTVAAWTAANRPEVARAVVVAPLFGLPGFGARANDLLTRIMLFLPNVSVWKDPLRRAAWEGMPHAYARQATRGTGEILRLARATLERLAEAPPAGGSLALVTNAADRAISLPAADRFGDLWAASGKPLTRYVFPVEDRLGHEIIDPMEPGADPALTYPVLIDLVETPAADR